jgi:hypothetical protein
MDDLASVGVNLLLVDADSHIRFFDAGEPKLDLVTGRGLGDVCEWAIPEGRGRASISANKSADDHGSEF